MSHALKLTTLIAALSCFCLSAQPLPPKMKASLQKDLKATPELLKTLEGGGIIAYVMDQPNPEEVVLVGAARVWATPDHFVKLYRDVVRFEAAPGVLAGAKFSNPPKESDLTGLRFSKDEVDDFLKCKPGDCDFKISDQGLHALQSKVNPSTPDYVEQANRAIRQHWIEYLKRYQASGNSALAVYHDTPKYFSVQKGLFDLVSQASFLRNYSPAVAEYLNAYPKGKLPGSEEFYYWQVGDFGLKPVHRASHVVITKIPATYGEGFVISSKMLFATHYFRSALELRYLIPGQDQKKGGMHYFITVQRSYVDGLTGMKGSILRRVVIDKSRQSMERYVGSVKDRLERSFNKRP
jgi:hypothetical protein